MKKENRVYLAAIRRRMQAKYRYENRKKRNQAFAIVWYGWVHRCCRLHHKIPQTFRNKWIRGYVDKADAQDFWQYITE